MNLGRAAYASFSPPATRSLRGACYLVYDRAIRGPSDQCLFFGILRIRTPDAPVPEWSMATLISRNRHPRGAKLPVGRKP